MSQFWHAHWAEDSFKPSRLGNWQVPAWHPEFPCRHTAKTTFQADRSGRHLVNLPKSKRSPWGDFKGTWELPLKIDRKLAWKLSEAPKYKKAAWEAHKIHYRGSHRTNVNSRKKEAKSPTGRDKIQITRAGARASMEKSDDRLEDRNRKSGLSKDTTESESITEPINELEQKDREQTVGPEQEIEDANREEVTIDGRESKEEKRSKCLCAKMDSHSPTEVTTKAPRKNICTIHQRLRV